MMTEALSGRALDATIAEKVMGSRVVHMDWPCGYDPESGHYEADKCWHPDHPESGFGCWYEEGPRGPVQLSEPLGNFKWEPRYLEDQEEGRSPRFRWYSDVEPVPAYSTDIADAWFVVMRMRENGWRLEVQDMGDAIAVNFYLPGVSNTSPEWRSGKRSSPTFQEAACLAALAAIKTE